MRIITKNAWQLPLFCLGLWLFSAFSHIPSVRAAPFHELPELGATPGELSAEQAYRLGRAWLRLFRSQVTTDDNPLLYDYLYYLTYELVRNSRLDDTRIDLLIINNPQLNAFAVPGGVIGVHNGLLLYAESESELAAVLAHEIAHLQQNHYARSREQARQRSLPTVAGILASVLLAATSNTDAALALLYSTQAANIESQLRYSRRYELEADRVGMEILANSNRPADAIPRMFERLLKDYRFRNRPPEFLLTHPVTERRIAEGRSAARAYPPVDDTAQDTEARFRLMRTYVQAQLGQKTTEQFLAELKQDPESDELRYGYALALLQEEKLDAADAAMAPLLKGKPSVPFVYSAADIYILKGEPRRALDIITRARKIYPNNYALLQMHARSLNVAGKPLEAINLLKQLTRNKPNEPGIWLVLAESYGLSGNIVGVHEANMEYLILNGRLDEAKQRARYAARLARGDFKTLSRLRNRIGEIEQLSEDQKEIR